VGNLRFFAPRALSGARPQILRLRSVELQREDHFRKDGLPLSQLVLISEIHNEPILRKSKMKKELPEINFDKHASLDIEVMDFEQLYGKLRQIKEHNPFTSHKIEFYLILVVTKNSYTHSVDFKSYDLEERSTLFVAKNQVHHFSEEGLQQANGFCIVFNHFFIDRHYFLTDSFRLNRLFNYHIESPAIHQKEVGADSLTGLIHQLHQEYNVPNIFAKSEILASLLRVILLKAERAKALHSVTNVNTHWLEIFSEFRNILEEEYVNTRNSKTYASKLFVSYKLLNDIVKKLTGKTVKAFIDDFVTVEIKRYLISTSLSVNEVSYKAGFEEPSNMVKFFKKNTSTTPLRFRQQL
jgi:AraC-like DNA-binding protein